MGINKQSDYCECREPEVKHYEAWSTSIYCTKCKKLLSPDITVSYKWVKSLSTIHFAHGADGNIIKL